MEEGKARGSLTLEDFGKEVEVDGRRHMVETRGGEAVEEKQNGKKLLRIKITAEVGRVEGDHTIADRVVREYTSPTAGAAEPTQPWDARTPESMRLGAERQTPRGTRR